VSDLPPSSLRGAVDLSGLVRRAAAPAQAAPQGDSAPADPSLVFETTDAAFQSVLELSSRVPVVVEFIAPGLNSALGPIVQSYGGRLVLAVVDGSVNPNLAQAFQVREVPAVAAVIAGRPVNLFLGIPSDPEVRQVLDELLQLAAENGVTGTVPAEGSDASAESAEPVEEPLPPRHQEAYDAIERGDYPAAIAAYKAALVESPRDQLAIAGLAQVSLLDRLSGAAAADLREAAAANRDDVDAQLAVADLDVSGGHLDDGFGRLLDLFVSASADDRTRIRTRLLEYFEIAGTDDPRVGAARRRLTTLLY